MKKRLPHCPYCKKQLSYLETWKIHKKGEYVCSVCQRTSNIRFGEWMKIFAFLGCTAGVLLTLLFSLILKGFTVWKLLLVLAPFLLFFVFTPFHIYLQPFQILRKNDARDHFSEHFAGVPTETTVMPQIRPAYPYVPSNDPQTHLRTQQIPNIKQAPTVDLPNYEGYHPKHGPKNPIEEQDINQMLNDFKDSIDE